MNFFWGYPNAEDFFPLYKITSKIRTLMVEHVKDICELFYPIEKLILTEPFVVSVSSVISLGKQVNTKQEPVNVNTLGEISWVQGDDLFFSHVLRKKITPDALLYLFYTKQVNDDPLDLTSEVAQLALLQTAINLGIVTTPHKQPRPRNFRSLFNFQPMTLQSFSKEAQEEFYRGFAQERSILLTGSTGIGKTVSCPILVWRHDMLKAQRQTRVSSDNLEETLQVRPAKDPIDTSYVVVVVPRIVMTHKAADTFVSLCGFSNVSGTPVCVKHKGKPVRYENDDLDRFRPQIHFVVDPLSLLYLPENMNVTTIIFDEVHEKSKFSIIGISAFLKKRPQVRLILVSATLEHELQAIDKAVFCLVKIDIKGPTRFPIHEKEISPKDDLEPVFRRHQEPKSSQIVFLPSRSECLAFLDRYQHLEGADFHLVAFTRQEYTREPKLLEEIENTKTCVIIFATNILESSVTIKNVKVVIDTGRQFTPIYRSGEVRTITHSSYMQRKGRVGRVAEGWFYRMYLDVNLTPTENPFSNTYLFDYLIYMFSLGLHYSDLLFYNVSLESLFEKTIEYYGARKVDLRRSSRTLCRIKRSLQPVMDEYCIVFLKAGIPERQFIRSINHEVKTNNFLETEALGRIILEDIPMAQRIARIMDIRLVIFPRKDPKPDMDAWGDEDASSSLVAQGGNEGFASVNEGFASLSMRHETQGRNRRRVADKKSLLPQGGNQRLVAASMQQEGQLPIFPYPNCFFTVWDPKDPTEGKGKFRAIGLEPDMTCSHLLVHPIFFLSLSD